jgi:hypothetical protein
MKNSGPFVEPLESRIAPAGLIIVSPHVATYTDSDGDHVTVKTPAGNFGTDATFTFTTAGSLAELSLGPTFTSANITFSVVRVAGGDGLANVGYIDAGGINLGNVTVAGDLGRILASSGSNIIPAVKTLTVNSLGRLGLDSQQGLTSPTLESDFIGSLGALNITHDDDGAYINVTGGNIGSIHIGGSLIGGSTIHSGDIATTGLGNIGSINIGHDIQGGSDSLSGTISCSTTITGPITIGGSIIGGTGIGSGSIGSTSGGILGPIKIGQNIIGGGGELSGAIITDNGNIGNVTIGGSLIGGSAEYAGAIDTQTAGNIGTVKIGHNVQGGSAPLTGGILSLGSLAGVSIGGSLLGGSGLSSGYVDSTGALGPVIVGHNVIGMASGSGLIASSASIGAITIGGSLIGSGGTGELDGIIKVVGNIGPIKIGQDIVGGGGEESGIVYTSGGDVPSVTVGGSIIGGAGQGTGIVEVSGILGNITVGHDIEGLGLGLGTGGIYAGVISKATIGGSLIGGPTNSSGVITAGSIGSIKIAGDITGGSIGGTAAAINASGMITSTGSITSIIVGGSIISGTDTSTAANAVLTNDGTIRAALNIGSITVGGSLIGNPDGGSGNAASPVIISAAGPASPVGSTDVAFGKITIGGRVEDAEILAGYNATLTGVNADAQIGPVKVGGDWIASDLVAGATNPDVPATGALPNFGDGSDVKLSGAGVTDSPDIISKIASVTIGGEVFGTPASVSITDSYGFVAESIGAFKAGGVSIAIPAGNTLLAIGETSDVSISVIV